MQAIDQGLDIDVWDAANQPTVSAVTVASLLHIQKRLSDQINSCNGIKLLTSLLTSPSASINLAGGSKSSGGFKRLRQTASVQGMGEDIMLYSDTCT